MFDFHSNEDWYFQIQERNCNEYVIPFIETFTPLREGLCVLEIGCGEAGVLKAFLERGCKGLGVELEQSRLVNSRKRMSSYIDSGQLTLIAKDIYEVDSPEELIGEKFDVIVLKDVIEHIHDQKKLLVKLKSFLKPGGVIYFGFPPWQMPFGGHQQMCRSKFLSRLPYFHLLPVSLYRFVLKMFKEGSDEFLEIKETGISIERFEKITKKTGYEILNSIHFFINPIYKYKFNMKVRKQAKIIKAIPYLRNFFTTSVFYLIRVKEN